MRISHSHIALGAIATALTIALSFSEPTRPVAPATLTAPDKVAVYTLDIADTPTR